MQTSTSILAVIHDEQKHDVAELGPGAHTLVSLGSTRNREPSYNLLQKLVMTNKLAMNWPEAT